MQDHCGASNGDDPSGHKQKGELLRCECCDALLLSVRRFALGARAGTVSCIVCGHQNDLSPSTSGPSASKRSSLF